MSNSSEATRTAKLDYVMEALQLHPATDSERIIAWRMLALGLDRADGYADADETDKSRRDRQAITRLIRNLRSDFWELPCSKVEAALQELGAAAYPDVQLVVNRLKPVAAERDRFLNLLSESCGDAKVAQWLKEVLVQPARETTTTRQLVRLSFRQMFRRQQYLRLLDRVEDETPEIYRLEADWFEQLRSQRMSLLPVAKVSTRRQHHEPSESHESHAPEESSTAIPSWAIGLGLLALINLIRNLFDLR